MLSDKSIVRVGKPNIYERVLQKLRSSISTSGRKKLNNRYKQTIVNKDFTIICSNCMAGVLYHDIGMPFLSPTINLAFDGEDFCKFCENIPHYLSCKMMEMKTDVVPHPMAKLDDVEIMLVHYDSFQKAKEKWELRSQRVNYDKILIMATDRDGMVDHMERFDRLPYRKIMFTAKEYPQYDWAVYCPCFRGRPTVGVMTGVADFQGHRYYERYIDMVKILNLL